MLNIHEIRLSPELFAQGLSLRKIDGKSAVDKALSLHEKRVETEKILNQLGQDHRRLSQQMRSLTGNEKTCQQETLLRLGKKLSQTRKEHAALLKQEQEFLALLPNIVEEMALDPKECGEKPEFPFPARSWQSAAWRLGFLREDYLCAKGLQLALAIQSLWLEKMLEVDTLVTAPANGQSGADVFALLLRLLKNETLPLSGMAAVFMPQMEKPFPAFYCLCRTQAHLKKNDFGRLEDLLLDFSASLGLYGKIENLSPEQMPPQAASCRRFSLWFPAGNRFEKAAILYDARTFFADKENTAPGKCQGSRSHSLVLEIKDFGVFWRALLEQLQSGDGSLQLPSPLQLLLHASRLYPMYNPLSVPTNQPRLLPHQRKDVHPCH